MNYIVFDLEFNQYFDFKTGKSSNLNPNCPLEIIQIGAIKLNDKFEIIDKFNSMIKPTFYKRVHPYVQKITGITKEILSDKPFFNEVLNEFLKFIGKDDNIFCIWGFDDIKALYNNIISHNIDTKLITNKYINVQAFATKYLNYENGNVIGLKNAVTELNIDIKNNFHDAFNDAEYTTKVFQVLRTNEKIPYDTFNIKDILKKKCNKYITDTKLLIEYFNKKLNREITNEEFLIIECAYKLGKNRKFDYKNKKI